MVAGMALRDWNLFKRDASRGFKYYQRLPFRQIMPLLLAVFCLFSVVGVFNDLLNLGRFPYLLLVLSAITSGIVAVVYVLIALRYKPYWFIVVSLAQVPYWLFFSSLANALYKDLRLHDVPTEQGIRVAAVLILALVITSYSLFIAFIRHQGAEANRISNELELAHGIQKTLVPPVSLRTPLFEVYGISRPSEKVGGDLVDALCLPNGDAVAYLADIAGHGLQAGILMGMLKTAARTALLEAGEREAAQTLPVLLERLNDVLPAVKEPHMYATFTGLRLGADGSVYYALAASPPLLHWHASGSALSHLEEEQFPLGLLPVSGFNGQRLETAPGDLLVVATDGILECCDKKEDEFGIERLKWAIERNTSAPLSEIASRILEAANTFGKQGDDQTILLVRCL
jgi:serine phosphatase RsbU (regulator of sigma subunit)